MNEHTSTIDGVRLPRSLYVETARERAPTVGLRGDKSAGVVVIGAGFTGLSAACILRKQVLTLRSSRQTSRDGVLPGAMAARSIRA